MLLNVVCTQVYAQSQERLKSNLATNDISGDAMFTTHFIERGLSMSDSNPAMNASFLYNLGSQIRMGLWGSNISNLSATDDNFWFKFLAEFNVDFSSNLTAEFYVSDNHFYKSNQRNGQRAGAQFNYGTYYFNFEWVNNLEGTKSSAEYLQLGKLFNYGNKVRYGGDVGFTWSHTNLIKSYFDAKVLARYLMNTNTTFEAAITYNSNKADFGKRADPALYGSVKLTY